MARTLPMGGTAYASARLLPALAPGRGLLGLVAAAARAARLLALAAAAALAALRRGVRGVGDLRRALLAHALLLEALVLLVVLDAGAVILRHGVPFVELRPGY